MLLLNYFRIIIYFSCCIVISSSSHSDSTLELLHVLYRHGDRTPISHYETDPYKNSSYWPEGTGQLTNKGKAMEYDLGIWLRNRYASFVGGQFYPDELSVFSTDYDRTLMSAQCVLASFYYPTDQMRFNRTVSWLPTPIHTAPSGADMLLNVDAACPRVSNEVKKMNGLPAIRAYMKDHEDVFEYLSVVTGQKVETVLEVDFIYDTLMIEKSHNLPLPNWTRGYLEKMKDMGVFSFVMNTYTPELKRLRGGPLLGKVTDTMKKKVTTGLKEKIFMYSAHDSTVAILLDTMGVFDNIAPPYAATVLWELHNTERGHIVKLFYQNDSTMLSPAHQLTIPGCAADCPLDQWENLLRDRIPTDWSHECYRPDPLLDQYYIYALSASGTAAFLFAILLGLLIHRFLKKRRKAVSYEELAENDTLLITHHR